MPDFTRPISNSADIARAADGGYGTRQIGADRTSLARRRVSLLKPHVLVAPRVERRGHPYFHRRVDEVGLRVEIQRRKGSFLEEDRLGLLE